MSVQSNLERRATPALIGSDEVAGTAIFRADGRRVGQIERLMIDRPTGKVAYAVMRRGDSGAVQDWYPLPWSLLTYNPAVDRYEADITDQQLKGAPKYCKSESWDWTSRDRGQMLCDYYNVPSL